jgi:sugar O-acyltransferase (sialic acid O-acetyltransferase NeuD family)
LGNPHALKPIVILGAGGYAQEVAWIIDDLNNARPEWNLLGFVDPLNSGLREHYARPVFAGYDIVQSRHPNPFFACGIGTPAVRSKESSHAELLGWQPATLLHPSVVRARFVSVGEGTIIGAGSVLAPYSKLGRHCAINVQTTIGHNASVGDFSVISPGARILGHAVLEDHVFIGANASVYPGRRIETGAILGANSFLHTDLARGQSAIGVPARAFLPAATSSAVSESAATFPAVREIA